MNNILIYALLIPVFSFLITVKITCNNLSYDPGVLLIFPFIFLSKIAYRIGALVFIRKEKIRKLLPEYKEN
jgi:hypothetical protein